MFISNIWQLSSRNLTWRWDTSLWTNWIYFTLHQISSTSPKENTKERTKKTSPIDPSPTSPTEKYRQIHGFSADVLDKFHKFHRVFHRICRICQRFSHRCHRGFIDFPMFWWFSQGFSTSHGFPLWSLRLCAWGSQGAPSSRGPRSNETSEV